MPILTIFRILFALYLLYFAWPYIPNATTLLERYFWGAWLIFLLLVIGANLATWLKMTSAPIIEQKTKAMISERSRMRAER